MPSALRPTISLSCTEGVPFRYPLPTRAGAGPLTPRGLHRLYVVYDASAPLYVGHVRGEDQSIAKHLNDYHNGRGVGAEGSDTQRLSARLQTWETQPVWVVGVDWYNRNLPRTADVTRSVEGLLRTVVRPRFHTPGVSSFEEGEVHAL